ncbi:MAG: ROK family protein [Candidatus Omnitrophica bacterium]|nr:ROK family protein [Candidatus Omnitrophota bacterium]
MTNKYFIGIDVGGTKVYGGLVSPSGEILGTKKFATPPHAGVKDIVGIIEKLVKSLTSEFEIPLKNIEGVGVAIPGIVDNDGRVVATPNLKLGNVDLKKILSKKLKTKVGIGNDVNLGVLGERWLGAGRKAQNIVGIFPGTGVGGGVVIKNEFLTGAQGAAAELGHMTVDPNGPECSCGNKGCLEAFVGRWAMERDIRAALKRGEKSIITDLVGEGVPQIKSNALAKALKAKDGLVTRVFGRAVDRLASGCVSLNHVFNPDMFLLGGGVVEACGEHILPKIEAALKKDPFFKKLDVPKVVQSKLGDDAVMLGAVALVFSATDKDRLKKLEYYPSLKCNAVGHVLVKGRVLDTTSYIRADGKLKEPKDILPSALGDDELVDICKKNPELLIIALSKTSRVVVTAKGLAFLKKKKIELRILPLVSAVKAFTAAEERRAILFYL